MADEIINIPDQTFSTSKPPGGGQGIITEDQEEMQEASETPEKGYTNAMDALNAYHSLVNIAPELPETVLTQVAEKVIRDYDIDLTSTEDWRKKIEEIIQFAKMLVEIKTWGGDAVANVRYPLIAEGAINFNARAYPEIVKGKDVVKFAVAGADPDGKKAARADRVSQHMNYQIINEMVDWEEEEDKMLLVLPVMGVCFKKTYFDAVKQVNVSELVFPDELTVNYFAKNLETAGRITQRIELTKNDIVERIHSEVFTNFDIKSLGQPIIDDASKQSSNDEDAPHVFLEQHRWLDLDGDDYEEPYIVTVHRDTRKVVRICARYDLDGIETNSKGEIVRIEPVHYYTRFSFLPSIDGSFYCEGLGTLMLSMNCAVDDGVNQLLDAGSQANRPSGFLAAGIVLGNNRGGTSTQLKRGEWKTVENSGDDLRKGIVEAPLGRPSPVTLKMLDTLIAAGKNISMNASVLTEGGGANTPAATTLALIEQNLKPVSAVFKRIFRAHKSEFDKLVRLNRLYLSQDRYISVLDIPEADVKADYNSKDCNVYPILDPNNASDSLRIMKAQALMQMRGTGLNDDEINKRYLMALNIEDLDKVLPKEGEPDPIKEAQQKAAELAMGKLEAEINLINQQAATERVKQFTMLKGVDSDKAMLVLEAAETEMKLKESGTENLSGLNEGGKFIGEQEAAIAGQEQAKQQQEIHKADKAKAEADLAKKEAIAPIGEPGQGAPYNEKGMVSNNVENPGLPPENELMGEGM